MAYFFEITKDLISCDIVPPIVGETFGNPKVKKYCEKKGIKKIPFKLYDDDKTLYYHGTLWLSNPDSEEIFAPLDWAMWDSGCTTMKLFENGKWSVL